jgi:hypothetical protein
MEVPIAAITREVDFKGAVAQQKRLSGSSTEARKKATQSRH